MSHRTTQRALIPSRVPRASSPSPANDRSKSRIGSYSFFFTPGEHTSRICDTHTCGSGLWFHRNNRHVLSSCPASCCSSWTTFDKSFFHQLFERVCDPTQLISKNFDSIFFIEGTPDRLVTPGGVTPEPTHDSHSIILLAPFLFKFNQE